MRGDVVLVRTFGGKAEKRRVWDVAEAVVFVTNDEQFERLAAGEQAIQPIGFPKEDVFSCAANESYDGSVDWCQLVRWNAQ